MSIFAYDEDMPIPRTTTTQQTGNYFIPKTNITNFEYEGNKYTLEDSWRMEREKNWKPRKFQDTANVKSEPAPSMPDLNTASLVGPLHHASGPFKVESITKEDFDLIYRKWRYIRKDLITFSSLLLIELGSISPEVIHKLSPPEDKKKYGNVVQHQECLKRVLYLTEYLDRILVRLESQDSMYNIIYEMAGPHGKLIKQPISKTEASGLAMAIVTVVTTSYKSDNSPAVYQAFQKALKIIFDLTEDLTHWDSFGDKFL